MARRPTQGAPRFDRLELRNVRCFAGVTVPLDQRVTVIIGENGAGKTTLAEALSSLCAGKDEGLRTFPLRDGAEAGAILLHEHGAAQPAARWLSSGPRDRLPDDRYLFAYGRYRRVDLPPAPTTGPQIISPGFEGTQRAPLRANLQAVVAGRRTSTLFDADQHLLGDMEPALLDLDLLRSSLDDAQTAWVALELAVRSLGHGLGGLRVVERDERDTLMVERHGRLFPLRQLSDGYQAMLVIVLDLVLRYAFLAPAPDPMARPALVVIDEVDLHLHPRWQRRVVRQLARIFKGTQFVLTTHSPAVVQGAIDDGHAVVVLREKDGQVLPHALTERERKALHGAQLGSVLVDRRLFGVASRYSAKFGAVEQQVKRLRKKMEAGTATDADRAALLDALDELEGLLAKEERRHGDGPLLAEIAKVQVASLKRLAELNEEAKRGRA